VPARRRVDHDTAVVADAQVTQHGVDDPRRPIFESLARSMSEIIERLTPERAASASSV